MGAANTKTVPLVYCCMWSYKQVGSTDVSMYVRMYTLQQNTQSHAGHVTYPPLLSIQPSLALGAYSATHTHMYVHMYAQYYTLLQNITATKS